MPTKFQKTSLQLSPIVLQDMGGWPGLTQSEALRLSVERGHYLSCLNSDEVAGVASEYEPILIKALEDLGYEDYRLAVRSLPEIVIGFLSEENLSWQNQRGDPLQPSQLVEELRKMNAMERIGILDCIVAERYRRREKTAGTGANDGPAQLPTANDFEREIRERWRQSETDGASYVDINAGEIHRKLGGYPLRKGNRMASCCQVMTRLKQGEDTTNP